MFNYLLVKVLLYAYAYAKILFVRRVTSHATGSSSLAIQNRSLDPLARQTKEKGLNTSSTLALTPYKFVHL